MNTPLIRSLSSTTVTVNLLSIELNARVPGRGNHSVGRQRSKVGTAARQCRRHYPARFVELDTSAAC